MRLIDAEKAKKALTGWDTDPTDEEIEYTIDNIPSVDTVYAAGGCYCRECRYLQQDTHGLWCFRDYENPLKLDGFCSYGERRADNAAD